MKSLPKQIYVQRVEQERGSSYLSANESVAELMEDDGPSTIGVYQLVGEIRATKNVVVKPLRP